MKPSTFLTAGEASRATGKSIPTITRNVKNGKIANSRQGEDGEYEIDPTALFNRYPMIDETLEGKSNDTPNKLVSETPQNDDMLDLIKSMNSDMKALHRDLIEEKDTRIEKLNKDLIRAESLLTDQRTDAQKAKSLLDAEKQKREIKTRKRKLGLWERLKGGEIVEVVEEVA